MNQFIKKDVDKRKLKIVRYCADTKVCTRNLHCAFSKVMLQLEILQCGTVVIREVSLFQGYIYIIQNIRLQATAVSLEYNGTSQCRLLWD